MYLKNYYLSSMYCSSAYVRHTQTHKHTNSSRRLVIIPQVEAADLHFTGNCEPKPWHLGQIEEQERHKIPVFLTHLTPNENNISRMTSNILVSQCDPPSPPGQLPQVGVEPLGRFTVRKMKHMLVWVCAGPRKPAPLLWIIYNDL